jgi:hypothetical protein
VIAREDTGPRNKHQELCTTIKYCARYYLSRRHKFWIVFSPFSCLKRVCRLLFWSALSRPRFSFTSPDNSHSHSHSPFTCSQSLFYSSFHLASYTLRRTARSLDTHSCWYFRAAGNCDEMIWVCWARYRDKAQGPRPYIPETFPCVCVGQCVGQFEQPRHVLSYKTPTASSSRTAMIPPQG